MNGEELLKLAEVKRVPLQTGDILALYLPREPTMQEFDEMTVRLKAVLGRDVKIVVLLPGWDLKVMGPDDVPFEWKTYPGYGEPMVGVEHPADGTWSEEIVG